MRIAQSSKLIFSFLQQKMWEEKQTTTTTTANQKLMEEKGCSASPSLRSSLSGVCQQMKKKTNFSMYNNINSMFDVLFAFFIHENEGIGLKGYEQIENTFMLARCVSESSVNKRMYIFYPTACFFAHSPDYTFSQCTFRLYTSSSVSTWAYCPVLFRHHRVPSIHSMQHGVVVPAYGWAPCAMRFSSQSISRAIKWKSTTCVCMRRRRLFGARNLTSIYFKFHDMLLTQFCKIVTFAIFGVAVAILHPYPYA